MASEYAEEEEAYADDADPLVTERLADAANCQEAESESSDDAPLSSCWNTPIATEEEAVAPAPAVAAADGDATAARSPRQHPPQQRRRRLEKEQQQLQSLARQLGHQKKLNTELQQQLHAVRKNEVVAQLENRNKEKQLQINQLLQENRLLVHQQRLLTKQVDELHDDKDNFPMKNRALQEELRICKESLRRCKENQKDMDERAFRTHQQAVDLATKNKALLERLKKLEAAAGATEGALSPVAGSFASPPSSHIVPGSSTTLVDAESVIASQEDEITRLQQRVSLMKKTQRSEKVKQEHRLQISQAEVEQARQQLDTFHQQLFAKEKTIRSLYLQMKSLKRAVQDLTNAQQTNQHMQQMVFGRDVRLLGQHSPPRQNQQHYRASQQQLRQHSPDPLNASASAATQAPPLAAPRKETTDRMYHTLRQLGYIPSFVSKSPRKRFEHKLEHRDGHEQLQADGVNGSNDDEEERLPPNCIQGRLVPGPPPSSAARRAIQSSGSGRTPRSDVYTPMTPPSRRTSNAAPVTMDATQNEARSEAMGILSRDESDFGTLEDPMDRRGDVEDADDSGDDGGDGDEDAGASEAAADDDALN